MTGRRIRLRPRTGSAALALALGALWISSIGAAGPPGDARPAGAERWLYNPRERAARGLEELRAGRSGAAIEAFDTAARLAPEDPSALYDAATARLLLERQPGHAAELLERAAEAAPPRLAPHALYNLGNARLAAEDPAGAADAYRRALRRAPDLRPAKHNLELALRRLEREQAAARPPRETPEDEERSAQSDGVEGGENRGGENRAGSGTGAAGTLPQHFEGQSDMTAAQAAALLAAIDDLERRQRRQQAAEVTAPLRRGKGEKDW
ncbi:MAG: tetratricopeptide repeat protein [Acidobacteriota bacterium]|jgi:tetratricopeptide (TPR) repeat protein